MFSEKIKGIATGAQLTIQYVPVEIPNKKPSCIIFPPNRFYWYYTSMIKALQPLSKANPTNCAIKGTKYTMAGYPANRVLPGKKIQKDEKKIAQKLKY
jgi:hypothetical protein